MIASLTVVFAIDIQPADKIISIKIPDVNKIKLMSLIQDGRSFCIFYDLPTVVFWGRCFFRGYGQMRKTSQFRE